MPILFFNMKAMLPRWSNTSANSKSLKSRDKDKVASRTQMAQKTTKFLKKSRRTRRVDNYSENGHTHTETVRG